VPQKWTGVYKEKVQCFFSDLQKHFKRQKKKKTRFMELIVFLWKLYNKYHLIIQELSKYSKHVSDFFFRSTTKVNKIIINQKNIQIKLVAFCSETAYHIISTTKQNNHKLSRKKT
jgi:hypothetical protein